MLAVLVMATGRPNSFPAASTVSMACATALTEADVEPFLAAFGQGFHADDHALRRAVRQRSSVKANQLSAQTSPRIDTAPGVSTTMTSGACCGPPQGCWKYQTSSPVRGSRASVELVYSRSALPDPRSGSGSGDGGPVPQKTRPSSARSRWVRIQDECSARFLLVRCQYEGRDDDETVIEGAGRHSRSDPAPVGARSWRRIRRPRR